MFPLTRSLSLAAAGAVVALAASIPARADELAQNLGPVGPREPILTTVGSKRVIAFYWPEGGNCAVHVVMWNPTDVNAESTAGRWRISTPQRTNRFISGDHADHSMVLSFAEMLVNRGWRAISAAPPVPRSQARRDQPCGRGRQNEACYYDHRNPNGGVGAQTGHIKHRNDPCPENDRVRH
jgi:hypothetical protein